MQWIELLTPFRWPLAVVIAAAFLGRAVLALARSGIRVEIVTRVPIQIKTGRDGIEARVTKVKLL